MGYFVIRKKNQDGVITMEKKYPNFMPDGSIQLILDLIQNTGDSGGGDTSGYIAFGEWGEHIDDFESAANWTESGTGEAPATSGGFVREGNSSVKMGNTGGTREWTNTTSVGDLSDYTTGWIYWWVYLDNLTDITSLTYRIGSDASNYITYVWNQSDLALGWNFLTFEISTATETGTVVWTTIDYQKITTITTPATTVNIYVDDLRIAKSHPYGDVDDIVLGKEFSSSNRYAMDSTQRTELVTTIHISLTTAEGNNTDIREMALFGDDATSTLDTGTMIARTVMNEKFTKTSNEVMEVDYVFRM